jgi:hypothetical protein
MWQLPSACNAMSSSMAYYIGSMSAQMCTFSMGTPLPTNIATCFPTYFGPTVTASNIYNCLQTSAMCKFETGCATATYTVGQEPSATATPAPASTTGVLTNGGFESGNINGWTLTDRATPFTSTNASTGVAHSGTSALRIVFQNDNGKNSILSQTTSVVPGGNYSLSMWVMDTNQLPDCAITLYLSPWMGVSQPRYELSFRTVTANVWQQMSLNFQAAASFLTVSYNYYCNGYGTGHTTDGYNTIYVDDVFLVRTD